MKYGKEMKEQAVLRILNKETRICEENEFLKKAAAFFLSTNTSIFRG
jgi:hypothetical protein